MSFPSATKPRVFAALLLAAGVAWLGLALKNYFASASYDSLHHLSGENAAALANSPVVLVYLDLPSFALKQQDPTLPWPRSLHAQLLRQLTAAQAKAVVFDIVFSAPSADSAADEIFSAAMRDNRRVVLAGESNNNASDATRNDQPWTRRLTLSPPLALFATNAAAWGIAAHIVDDDFVVRRYLAGFSAEPQPSLTWAAGQTLRLPATRDADAMRAANFRWLRYYGPALALPHVSYAQALAPDGVPENFFRHKIVFIGARPMAELFNQRQDEFRNPFHSWGNKELFMPGVEVHATEMLNLLRDDWLWRLSNLAETFLLLSVALLFGVGLVWLRPIPATFVAIGGAGLTLAAALTGFEKGVWFPWLIVSAVQIPTALFGSWLWQFQEWFFTRRKMEAAKKIADAKIREQAALIDTAHDAILVQSLDGQILYANPSAETLFGWTATAANASTETPMFSPTLLRGEWGPDCAPQSFLEIFSADPITAKTARAAALKDGEWNGELKLQTRAGNVVIVASRWTLVRDDTGRPKALLLINSDVTEQKNLEAQFLRTQRMNTIGTLAGGMAHDLNNALAPVLLGAQLLRRRTTDPEDRNLLTLMETSTARGAEMVRQVLLFARGRGGEFERLELAPVVRELEKMVRETFPKDLGVETFLPPDLWAVRGNPTQLHQVLLNLCVNARDAMPAGGRLSFAADNVTLSETEAAVIPEAKPGEFVSLLVSDTGTGIPPEVRAKMFEPFFTTKGEGRGTGIGLSTVIRIVKAHGGFLRVDSEPGEGATFEIFLPRAAEVAPVAVAEAVEIPRGRGELILIADDERAVRELVGDSLTALGYRILSVANGEEALRLFQQHGEEIRLLLTDSAMPVMNGEATIAALRKLNPRLPVVLASAEADTDSALAKSATAFLRKPFSLDELLEAVSRALK